MANPRQASTVLLFDFESLRWIILNLTTTQQVKHFRYSTAHKGAPWRSGFTSQLAASGLNLGTPEDFFA